MKTYRIESFHMVHIDDYNEGETEYKNSYSLDATIKAENPKEALRTYIEKNLHYVYNEFGIDNDEGQIFTSYLVDVENEQATEAQVKEWKNGKIVLYSNTVHFTMYELTQITEI